MTTEQKFPILKDFRDLYYPWMILTDVLFLMNTTVKIIIQTIIDNIEIVLPILLVW